MLLLALFLSASTATARPAEVEQREKAEADDAHTREAARTLAAQGAQAFEAQEYDQALDLFQRAGSLIEAPTIVLMEARTLVALGRWVEAANKYRLAQLMDTRGMHNEAYAAAVAAAAEELQLLKPRIPLVKVELVDDLANQEVEVWIDERQLPTALVGVDNPIDPGQHRVEIRPRLGSPRAREFAIAEAFRFGTRAPEVLPEAQPVAAPAEPRPLPVDEPEPPASEARDPVPWIVLGAGATATVIGGVTGLVALSKKSDLDDADCEEGCPPSFKDDITSFRRYRTVSYIGFGVGLLGIGWGTYLLSNSERDETTIGLWLTPQGATVNGKF